ncbi:membrane-bound lytic murein transglycosylase B [Rhodobium orientis]|uniref:lytic murein transglycosylase n=1 Tax=Rhodobium orientis TaxID=34017 RepID=UPI0018160A0C|nr:lytic murein transglycosylase [Rhodobium orientis]MBB4302900.1 membrane-bound lytic murein transglycosylase B [Rhodobium orientis]
MTGISPRITAGSLRGAAFLVGFWAAVVIFVLAASVGAKADARFDRWIRDFWPTAKAAGVSWDTYRSAFAGVSPDPDILKKASRQPEFVTPIWEYLGSAASERRVENGREKLVEWKTWLDRIEAKYGVDRHVVVAIWGMESSYGEVLNNPKIVKNVIRSLSTLAYAGGKRQRFGESQLVAALKILERGDVSPRHMTGSWAGAMGHTQFIPTTFEAYAVDMDGDGRRNIWTSIPDALGSTAAYLNRSGWVSGKTWGYEVDLPRGFNFALADGHGKRSIAEWQALGVTRVLGRVFPRPDDEAYLLMPAGARGPAFLMLKNFRVIKRYNNADAYALAVGHLADKLMGAGSLAASWPREEKPLTHSQTRELQALLNRLGYGAGSVDGKLGPKTRAAIRDYQKRIGMPPDGYANTRLLSNLKDG